jgi:hypothetical protein
VGLAILIGSANKSKKTKKLAGITDSNKSSGP